MSVSDPGCPDRYHCSHTAGVHTVLLPWVHKFQQFLQDGELGTSSFQMDEFVFLNKYGRGGSRNSLRGGGGGSGPEFFEGGGGRVQVRGNFHILTSKKKQKKTTTSEQPLTPPLWIRYCMDLTNAAIFTIAICCSNSGAMVVGATSNSPGEV